ncbi:MULTISPECIES: VOC family protein [unclassified Corallococcus]|uniref:VOC family protein n=1 Tax=unclassified Corallococcus TaxID=2685029 RepID=UPI001A8FA012|nr:MULTISPECIES: VOC family protein [unclassified Corallococcus]MBN9686444.1 VOC family protein [Corallococcus sp. NCSPR001]WAS82128.1 VOC family protein [Corallococcus sp. NCRR]
MRTLNYLLLPVRSPRESAKLYTQLLGREPVENSETFVLYVLPTGLKVGLWLASEMTPTPRTPGGLELAFTEESREAVLQTYAAWTKLGLKVLQEPTDMDFGFTFVVEDPDGHRLRPFVLAANPR